MKAPIAFLGLGISVGLLVSCAQRVPPTVSTGLPYTAYATNQYRPGPANSPYRAWTTAQLQERRRELYYEVPYRVSRRGVPEYVSHGVQLPQQDEIRAIEGELIRRYEAGDKAAELKPVWPEVRKHPI